VDEPDDQGRDRQAISLRIPRSTRSASRRLRRRLQPRPASQKPQPPHTLWVRLQTIDNRTWTIQTESAPANAGTKHLAWACTSWCGAAGRDGQSCAKRWEQARIRSWPSLSAFCGRCRVARLANWPGASMATRGGARSN